MYFRELSNSFNTSNKINLLRGGGVQCFFNNFFSCVFSGQNLELCSRAGSPNSEFAYHVIYVKGGTKSVMYFTFLNLLLNGGLIQLSFNYIPEPWFVI